MSYVLANLHIREVMSSPPITVPEGAPLEEAGGPFRKRGSGAVLSHLSARGCG
jgi:CBS domain-containing protein